MKSAPKTVGLAGCVEVPIHRHSVDRDCSGDIRSRYSANGLVATIARSPADDTDDALPLARPSDTSTPRRVTIL
jgi:hypothetical protein